MKTALDRRLAALEKKLNLKSSQAPVSYLTSLQNYVAAAKPKTLVDFMRACGEWLKQQEDSKTASAAVRAWTQASMEKWPGASENLPPTWPAADQDQCAQATKTKTKQAAPAGGIEIF